MRDVDRNRHGNLCECKLLAEAIGGDSRNLTFGFCRNVLMRRWVIIDCNHGCQDAPPVKKKGNKWQRIGPIDPIKAILIKNE